MARGDWQLGNWIRSSQQNSGTESQSGASESPTHKEPTKSSKHSLTVEAVQESKPQLSSHQKEFTDRLVKPQQHSESHQNSQKSPSADLSSCSSSRKLSCNTHSSKPAKAVSRDRTEAAVGVKCEDARDKDNSFTDRPKVKTKTARSKKSTDSSDTKRDNKRTSKHTSLDKRKPEVTLCPSCGVRYPNPCSCPTQSSAQPDLLSPAPPLRVKLKSEPISQKGTKNPHKTTHKQTAKSSRDNHRPPRSLLVKIDLSLLSRVPRTSGNHQEIPSSAKRSVLVKEQDRGGSDASATHKITKTSKKSISQNVRNMCFS